MDGMGWLSGSSCYPVKTLLLDSLCLVAMKNAELALGDPRGELTAGIGAPEMQARRLRYKIEGNFNPSIVSILSTLQMEKPPRFR